MDPDQTVEEILAAYLQSHESGTATTPDDLIARHPEFAAELAEFFDLRRYLDRLVTPDGAGATGPDPTFPHPFGEYQILAPLGCGGMGIVLKARHTPTGRVVALKVSRSGRFAPPEERRRFRTEAEACLALDHPGIVPVYSVGETDGQPYFTMRLLSGGTLADRRAEFADPRAACRLVLDLASAVEHAHRRGVLHRDLKPSNVVFDDDGRPHLSDFGLARVGPAGDLTRTGAALGTPSYMAPEQRSGRPGTETTATDIHGLGGILFFALTGASPYPTSGLVGGAVTTPALPPSVPGDVAAICLKCLQADPRQRYAGPQDLADDLTRLLTGRPVRARRIGPVVRFAKAVRRHPVVAVLATVAAAALAAAAYFAASEYSAVRRFNTDLSAALGREQTQRERLARADFASRLRQAADLAEAGHPAEAYDLLLQLRPVKGEPDRRGFAWHYLRRQLHPRRAFQAHNGAVICAAVAPDGHTAASLGDDGFVRVWDLAAERELAAWKHGTTRPQAMAYRPDGTALAIAGDRTDGGPASVVVTDLTGRQLAATTTRPVRVHAAVWSADGRRVLVRGGGNIEPPVLAEWDVTGGGPPVELDTAGWEATDVRTDPNRGTWAVSFVRDGASEVRVGSPADPLPRGRTAQNYFTPAWAIDFSPDGERLAVVTIDSIVIVADVATGAMLSHGRIRNEAVEARLCWADGGESLLVSTTIKGASRLDVLDARTGVTRPDRPVEPLWAYGLARDWAGRVGLLWCGDGMLHFRSPPVSASEQLAGHMGEVWTVAFSPDDRLLASGSDDGTIRLWDVASRAELRVLHGHESLVMQVAFTPDGQELVSSGWDGTVRRWEVATGRPVATWAAHDGPAEGMALTTDGRFVVSHGRDNRVNVWDRRTHSLVRSLPGRKENRQFVAVSPDGRWVATGGDGRPSVRVWDSRDWSEVAAHAAAEPAVAAAFTPDGRELVVALKPNRVAVWNPATGKTRLTFHAREKVIRAVACTPDGGAVLTTGYHPDTGLRLWNLENGQPILTLTGHSDTVNSLAFSRDGRSLASGSHDQLVRLWLTHLPGPPTKR